jgi:hypothetical protein
VKDDHDVNRVEFRHADAMPLNYWCSTCGQQLVTCGTAGYLDLHDPKHELAKKVGSFSSADMLALSKARVFAATVTTRDHHQLNGGASLVTTSSTVVYFCSRLCRSVYRDRLYMALYPGYFPYHEPTRSENARHFPGSDWDGDGTRRLVDIVPFDDPDAPSCYTCENGVQDGTLDGDAICLDAEGCDDEVPFKHYTKRQPKEGDES